MYNRWIAKTLIGLCVLVAGTAVAQTKTKGKVSNDFFEIMFGNKLQIDKDYRVQRLLPRANGGYLIQSFGKNVMGLDVVNEKFEQSNSKVHNIRKELERRDENLVTFGGRSFWVNSSNDEKTDERAYLQEINDDNGDLAGDEIQIVKSKDIHSGVEVSFSFFGGGGSMAITQSERYHYSISPDSSKLLVYYKKKPVKKMNKVNKDIYGFVVVDDNFKIVWNKEVEMPKTEFMMEFFEAEVTNEGTVFILG